MRMGFVLKADRGIPASADNESVDCLTLTLQIAYVQVGIRA
jgi:hypothetical protein